MFLLTSLYILNNNIKSNLKRHSSVQSLSCVQLFATPWTATRQASLSITNSWSLPKLMSIESVMPPNHLILCRPPLLPPSIFPSIRVFSDESALRIRWPKYWEFQHQSFQWTPRTDLLQDGLVGSPWSPKFKTCSTIVQKHQFFSAQVSLQSNSHIHTWLLEKP